MKSKLLGWAATLTLLVAFDAASAAEDKVEIGVVFEVQASHFTNAFDPADVTKFTAQGGAAIALALDQQIRFVEFSNNPAAAYRLQVLLADPERKDPPGASSFGFHLKLTGPEIPASAKDYVEFRPKDRFFEPVSSVDALVREIGLAFEKIAGQGFVKKFLSDIPIADNAEFHKDESLSWIIKRDRQALCIGFDSVLKVRGQIPFGTKMQRTSFSAKVIDIPSEPGIFAKTMPSPESDLELLKDVDQAKVKVERVGVSDYFLCQEPVSPGDASFPEAGGGQ
jgi:hypothetical protein